MVLEGKPLVLAFHVVIGGGRIEPEGVVRLITGRLEHSILALATFLLLTGLGSGVSFLFLLLGLAREGIVEQLGEELKCRCSREEFIGLEARGYCYAEIVPSQELEDANAHAEDFGRMRSISFLERARMPTEQSAVVEQVVAWGHRSVGKTDLSKLGRDQ